MSASPYQQSRQQSQQAPSPDDMPGLVILLNYPPSGDQELLALVIPIYLMFSRPDRKLTPYAREFDLDLEGYGDELFVMIPKSEPTRFVNSFLEKTGNNYRVLFPVLLKDIRMYHARGHGGRTGDPIFKLFSVKDEAMTLGRSFVRASDQNPRRVYEAPTEDELKKQTDPKSEVVVGIEPAFAHLLQITPDSADGHQTVPLGLVPRFVAGIFMSEPINITYESRSSKFLPASLYPSGGKEKTDYFTEMSDMLIARARKINALLNVLAATKALPAGNGSGLPADLRVEIGGHTDCSGSNNQNLSMDRATEIVKFLTSTASIKRIVANPDGTEFKHLMRYVPKGYRETECDCAASLQDEVEKSKYRKITLRLIRSAVAGTR